MRHEQKNLWFLGTLIFILLLFIVIAPSWGMQLRAFIGPRALSPSESVALETENISLKAQLGELGVIKNQLPVVATNEISAMVYSTYPMNFKNEVTLNVGSDDGVAPRDAVLLDGGLFGLVERTATHQALVETVFDPRFRMPIRIGTAGYDGLFTGGPYPRVTLIAKDAKLAVGDVVYAASADVPYAIPIAELSQMDVSPSDSSQEASLSFAYDANAVQAVAVVIPPK